MVYDPRVWYWTVATKSDSVFSGASGSYVPTSDATYQAWRAAGYWPTPLPDEQTLADVVMTALPNVVPSLPAALMAYAQRKQAAIARGGISVNVGTAQSPNMVQASTDAESLILLQGAYTVTMTNANSNLNFNWAQSNGAAINLTAEQLITIFNAVTAFIQSTFNTLSGVLNAIRAGTITTQAQIDSPPAPIPPWPLVTPTPSSALRSPRSPGSSTARAAPPRWRRALGW
jgi:hypothetical protein